MASEPRWGVYDTHDDCWIGDDHGPKLFVEEALAQAAAMVVDAQMCWRAGRCRAVRYDGGGTVMKDELKTTRTPMDALKYLERGGL